MILPGTDGGWGAWSAWGECSVTCGGGEEVRRRECDNPAPQGGGEHCQGEKEERRECGEGECGNSIEIPTECGMRKGANLRVVGGGNADLIIIMTT